jgi:hypothetical protein
MDGAAGFAAAALERAVEALSSLLPGFTAAAGHGGEEEEELRRLGRTMRRIRAALEDHADGSRGRAARSASAAASLRLRELRCVAYDAEDVVGECEYEAARREAEALDPVRRAGGRLKRVRREVRADRVLLD